MFKTHQGTTKTQFITKTNHVKQIFPCPHPKKYLFSLETARERIKRKEEA